MPRFYVHSFDEPFRQKDGFYEQADGTICFWPSRHAPGHIVPETAKEQLASLNMQVKSGVVLAAWSLVFLMPVSLFLFAINGTVPFLFYLSLGAIVAVLIFGGRVWRSRQSLLNEMTAIDMPRPPEIDNLVKLGSISRTTRFLAYFALLALATLFGVIGFMGPGVLGLVGAATIVMIMVIIMLHYKILESRSVNFEVKDHLFPGRWSQDQDGHWRRIGGE